MARQAKELINKLRQEIGPDLDGMIARLGAILGSMTARVGAVRVTNAKIMCYLKVPNA